MINEMFPTVSIEEYNRVCVENDDLKEDNLRLQREIDRLKSQINDIYQFSRELLNDIEKDTI